MTLQRWSTCVARDVLPPTNKDCRRFPFLHSARQAMVVREPVGRLISAYGEVFWWNVGGMFLGEHAVLRDELTLLSKSRRIERKKTDTLFSI